MPLAPSRDVQKSDPLKCGECGGSTFTLTHVAPVNDFVRVGGQGSGGFPGVIYAECTECKSGTRIEAVPARLTVGAEGTLAGGWRS